MAVLLMRAHDKSANVRARALGHLVAAFGAFAGQEAPSEGNADTGACGEEDSAGDGHR